MYYLVEFLDKTVEVVPGEWFDSDESPKRNDTGVTLAFPLEKHKLRQMIAKKVPSQTTWPTFKVTVLYVHGMLFFQAKIF
jgi:hypothetical protein